MVNNTLFNQAIGKGNTLMLKNLSITHAADLLQDPKTALVDIRDQNAFQIGHIPGAKHLHNGNLQQVLHELEFDQPVIVCCYHGISSQQAGQFLIEQGFEDVYSLEGGFEQWAATGNPVAKD